MKISREHEFTINRCYDCGRYWALELGLAGLCPKCAYQNRCKRTTALDDANKTIAALRGELTKARKARTP